MNNTKTAFLGFAMALAMALAGCSSTPLNEAPVDNKSAQTTQPQPPSQTQIAQVQTGSTNSNEQGPQGVARLVYFDFDSNVIKPEYQSIIDGHARFLRQNPSRHIFLEGHTDDRGGREYNLALGQRRAESVRSALKLLGVQDTQMEAVSFGKEKPADPGHDENAWAKNRRVEIVYR
ncbi:MAG TPA: peptidoglycan-associated lipoprotein Pal [Ramlibacter sp.]|nr:peptidoglycan-associated lipoprotein Pal [Ramlibacter sp.]